MAPSVKNGGESAGEDTPLLRDARPPPSPTHLEVPGGSRPNTTNHHASSDASSSGDDSGDEIDPNDFDMLLSRSVPTSGGFLEPEPYENPMLRGPRRYSTTSKRLPSHSQSRSRSPSASPSSPLLESPPSSPPTPFLNNISVARFWVIFSIILCILFIACFDSTIMASSHPVITSYFHSSNSASWVSTAFLLTSTASQPLLGRISDSLGRKPPYLVTMIIFAIGTLWCALAGSMTSFILARAACGVGAGGMMTLGGIIISDMVPIETRGTYQSYINIVYGIGSALGAALGGAMADYLGWRWEFGVQVLPLLLCCVAAFLAIPNDLGLVDKRQTLMEALRIFDFRGSILLTTTLTFMVLGLNLGGNVLPWSHPLVVTSLCICTVGFPTFIYSQSLAARPIMPLRLLRHSPHANIILSNFCGSLIMNAILFNMPLFFQAVLLTSATESGLRLVTPSLVASVAGTATGFIISRTRRLKWALVTGTSFYMLGSIGLCLLQRGWHPAMYLAVLVPHALGQGFQFPGTVMSVLAVSEQRDQAVVTATLVLWRSLGTVLGIASSSLVLQNALVALLARNVDGPKKWEVIEKVRSSIEAVIDLEEPYREQVILSYETAVRLTFVVCGVLAVISFCIIIPAKLPRLGERK
ncbi:multidrug resistance protein fnx1 [Plectosphaerella plurivora]|uniref:Multidrug resistance protein fnx1 n=1 Tax=Plectosphaerella plurivora TaxID=936078 RepID=A0A9P8V6Q1_9PEZI|nr:multidrug resistance protein fnx1 [Plectosphaerella plurivora]